MRRGGSGVFRSGFDQSKLKAFPLHLVLNFRWFLFAKPFFCKLNCLCEVCVVPRKPTILARQARERLVEMAAPSDSSQCLPTLAALSKDLNLHPFTIFRILKDMALEGVVWQSPSGSLYSAAASAGQAAMLYRTRNVPLEPSLSGNPLRRFGGVFGECREFCCVFRAVFAEAGRFTGTSSIRIARNSAARA